MSRKKTKRITLQLVPLVAAAILSGCEGAPDSTQVCADGVGKVLPSSSCEDNDNEWMASEGDHDHYHGVYSSRPRWYYMPGGAHVIPVGSSLPPGGSYIAPKSGVSSVNGTSDTVSRGFFGRSSSSHSSSGHSSGGSSGG